MKMNVFSSNNSHAIFSGLIMCLSVALLAGSCQGNQPFMQESRVWLSEENGKTNHRILGLTVSKNGTVMAFTEARDDGSDEGPHDLVFKSSFDGGSTWSENVVLEKGDGTFWAANGQPDKRESWSNPAALTDLHTGRIFIFYVLNEGRYRGENTQRMSRVFYKTSDDEGHTWSERVEITDVLNSTADGKPNVDECGEPVLNEDGLACDYLGRAFHMPGPGHGIQLSDGRLMLQFWHRKRIGWVADDGTYHKVPNDDRLYGSSVIYSDDHGMTWKQGGRVDVNHQVTEARIAQLSNGDIFMNARVSTQPPAYRRWVGMSKDGGQTWAQVEGPDITIPPVDCGLIRIQPSDGKGDDWLLLSHPTGKKRQGLTVSFSPDGGVTWPVSKLVYANGSQYSDLVQLPDGNYGLIYEKTHNEPGSVSPSEIAFVRFNYEWLVQD